LNEQENDESIVNTGLKKGAEKGPSETITTGDELGKQKPIFMNSGHNAGDLVESNQWKILTLQPGLVEVDVHLPDQLKNPRDQLFGGFTGTYVDMLAIWAVRSKFDDEDGMGWATTINMRVDYLAPVNGPRFRLRGELINDGKSTCLASVEFFDREGNLLVYSITTLKKHG